MPDMDDPFTPGFDTGFDDGTGYGFLDANLAVQAVIPPIVFATDAQTSLASTSTTIEIKLSEAPYGLSGFDLDNNLMNVPDLEPISDDMTLDTESLLQARTAVDIGDYEAALSEYQTLLATGTDVETLIVDLRVAVAKNMEMASGRRLLGDAYMLHGELDKALAAYRSALVYV